MNAKASSFMPRQSPREELVFPDQDVIRAKGKELELDWDPSVDYVTELPDESLRMLFGKLYKGHRRKFAEHYGIPMKVFESYMHLSYNAQSRACIQRWLLHSVNLSHLIKEEQSVDVSHHIRSDVHDLCDSINMVRDEIAYICFVDGDNYPRALAELSSLPGLYIICYQLLGTFSYQMNIWKDSPFFSIRYTLQRGKDASDVLICMDTSLLHLLLPPGMPFVVISGDDFTAELTVNLQQLGRPVERIIPRIRNLRLHFDLLQEPELWSDVTQNPLLLAQRIKAGAIVSNLPEDRDSSKHIFWVGNQGFRSSVLQSTIVDIAIELVHLGLVPSSVDEEGRELDLRIQWKMRWTAPINQFYRKYNLTSRMVNRYLQGHENDRVDAAVRDFLSSVEH